MPRERYMTEIGLHRRRIHLLSRSGIFLLALAWLAVLALLFFLRLPLLKVREVSIHGNSYISSARVESLLLARVLDNSRIKRTMGFRNMLVWPEKMTAEDLKFLPEAASVDVAKDYLHGKISVWVRERAHEGIWCFKKDSPSVCYWFDAQGVITRTPYTEGSLILVVNDYSRSGVEPGEPVIEERFLANLFSIFEAVRRMGVNTQEIRLEDLAKEEIAVPIFNGPVMYFSLRFPAENAPAALAAVREKTSLSKLQKIDFRVQNRVYYE